MMQVSKKVPFDDPNTLNLVRGLYILSNVIIAGLYLYVQMQINKKKGTFTFFSPLYTHIPFVGRSRLRIG